MKITMLIEYSMSEVYYHYYCQYQSQLRNGGSRNHTRLSTKHWKTERSKMK